MNELRTGEELPIYVGTYASKEEEGIHLCGLNPETGALRLIGSTSGIENPSFLILNEEASRLYAVSEQAQGGVAAYAVDPANGGLALLNTAPTEGADPCHLSLPLDGGLLAANYSGGNVARFALDGEGSLNGLTSLVQHEGQGPRQDRQEAAHAHSAVPDEAGAYVYVSDLGMDQIVYYRTDEGKLVRQGAVQLPPGAGPRHFVFHPNGSHAYGINELNSTITIYARDREQGGLEIIRHVSTLPEGFAGENYPADIHLSSDGKYLYGSNRGHDSIVRFAVDPATGALDAPEWTGTGGKWPRNFAVLDGYVIVANQFSDNIVVFRRDADSGSLTETGQELALAKPSCVVPAAKGK